MTRVWMLPLSAALILGCARHETPKAPELPRMAVRLAVRPQGGEGASVAAALGAADQAVLATRLASSVRKVHVQEGSRVAAGTLLVSLADEDLQGQLKAAQAAEAAAQAHHRRITALAAQQAATPSELEQAATQVAQAQGAVALVKGQLANTQIRAPFAGVVQRKDVSEGAFVGPGQPLLTLEGSGLELTASLSEAEARGLKVGQPLSFEVDGRAGEARITALAPGGDPLSHRQALRAKVVKPTNLRSGSFARILLPAGTKAEAGEVRVPLSALVRRGELAGVFVAKEGRAELRWLSLGDAAGGSVAVKAGLAAGEPVIDAPGDLRDGQPVEVR